MKKWSIEVDPSSHVPDDAQFIAAVENIREGLKAFQPTFGVDEFERSLAQKEKKTVIDKLAKELGVHLSKAMAPSRRSA